MIIDISSVFMNFPKNVIKVISSFGLHYELHDVHFPSVFSQFYSYMFWKTSVQLNLWTKDFFFWLWHWFKRKRNKLQYHCFVIFMMGRSYLIDKIHTIHLTSYHGQTVNEIIWAPLLDCDHIWTSSQRCK